MKIMIDIPKEEYELVRHGNKSYTTELILMNAVANGTPLPEHHGRLVDADKLIRDTIKNPVHAPYIHIIDMNDAPTIIEAEGSDSE